MKVKILILSTTLSLFGCHREKREPEKKSDLVHNHGLVSRDVYRTTLQGLWASSEESNVVFEIKGDSLYYFEDPGPVYYEVSNDTFRILIEGEFFSSHILKLSLDSLIRVENGNVVKLYKRQIKNND